MQAALGITLSLIARERTGRGQHVDISMTDGIISLMHGEAAGYFDTGRVPTRGDLLSIGGAPFYGVYETKDGKYVSIAALEPWFYANLCELLGREDLLPYEWDAAKWDELSAEFRKIFRTKTRDEWVELLRQKDVCVAPVNSVNEVFEDPQVVQREMAVEIEHPTLGRVKQVGIGIKLSDTPGAVRSVAPKPGQHTDEILLELGYTGENIAELRGSGAAA
jgi:crotonobetainyl-CoA:carnitine CoA-transferase CaiB-like acyl-CoA transferase